MVKVGKLWGDANFQFISPLSKLLYCYLISQPSISTLGILVLNTIKVDTDLKLDLGEYLDELLEELKDSGYIDFFYVEDRPTVVILVIDHFKSLPKSKSNIRKGIDEGKNSKGKIKELLLEYFTTEDFQDTTSFTPPTAQEVADYALSLGFLVNGKDFVEYYGDNDWYDKNNKKVRNWKAKCRKVWCRDTNKLKTVEGAPKGFEYFFVEIEEGNRIYPTAWVRGLPTHSNHLYAEYLIEEYNDRRS